MVLPLLEALQKSVASTAPPDNGTADAGTADAGTADAGTAAKGPARVPRRRTKRTA